MSEFTCPDCPMCGQPPQILLSDQAFCGTDDCQVFMWIPSRTARENLADAVDLPPFFDALDVTLVGEAVEQLDEAVKILEGESDA